MQSKSINRYKSFCDCLNDFKDAKNRDLSDSFVLSGTVMYGLECCQFETSLLTIMIVLLQTLMLQRQLINLQIYLLILKRALKNFINVDVINGKEKGDKKMQLTGVAKDIYNYGKTYGMEKGMEKGIEKGLKEALLQFMLI